MDVWQKQIYDDCAALVSGDKEKFSLGRREAYIVMKALEAQQRYLHPLRKVKVSQD